MEEVTTDNAMIIEEDAIEGLHLFGDKKEMTLFKHLNRTHTKIGEKMIKEWIKQPLIDKDKINKRLELVEGFYDNSGIRLKIKNEELAIIPDLEKLIKGINKSDLESIVKLYEAVRISKNIKEELKEMNNKSIEKEIIEPLEKITEEMEKFEEMVVTLIDIEETQNHVFKIREDFDEGLQKIRESHKKVEELFEKCLEQAANDLNIKTDKIKIVEHNNNLILRVSKSNEKEVKKNKKYTIIQTLKGECKFTFKEMQTLNVKRDKLKLKEEEINKKFIEEINKVVEGYKEKFQELENMIGYIDCIQSFATVSIDNNQGYSKPTIYESEKGIIKIIKARHPLIENNSINSFIENDIDIDRKETRFQIITGPNMGGKSTYLRMIGLCVIMAQIGMFIPCSEAHISICDKIMCRIGAGDNIVEGMSTFMSEMKDTSEIIKKSTKNSLVLIDELGRGTSTYDGFGIAWAISEYLAIDIGCYCVFATHFHEITGLEKRVTGVINKHVEADIIDKQLVLKYKINNGSTDQSLAIYVAEWADFPHEVVESAKRKAKELDLDQPDSKRKIELFTNKIPLLDDEIPQITSEDILNGKSIISQFIHDYKSTPSDQLISLQNKYHQLLLSNPFLKQLELISLK
ncbi:DNA mismatch repair protein msh2 putative [Entamoeba histolytica]|uniref:DNA mismatch repair protein Msh2, putative n=3 Tax=Entamoeba histolytica TaxID=5759 RepID=B1N4L6_ENTH1|nr:DNA mismatch repair protein Msh2, putative [Entamoeba histolytica HM-1:IMSS]EDS89090.1 DNA mismatch repair protein Msh2, putative [Entamoeba histolytica HM-1:IMSS]EMD45450.1 DNA mismatch repair protein MSH2, putative [Entamoeba histolytica KU27]GAT98555.1 DNA mismatch repair protein msh2 putative [Entamoeba histolytica]|eukprot:XP_001914132.1 DNA mismatch repair protein Msh2, putative [Entamoeba histolytica HM-1:IMSS]